MRKETMLVVEDEDIMREALCDYFSDEGHKVDTANDGDKALEKFNLEDYNVMIVDLKLPGRDGLSVLKEIRAKNSKAKVFRPSAGFCPFCQPRQNEFGRRIVLGFITDRHSVAQTVPDHIFTKRFQMLAVNLVVHFCFAFSPISPRRRMASSIDSAEAAGSCGPCAG